MITEVLNSKGVAAITSDQWHLVRSHYTGGKVKRPYARVIVSEHPDRQSCRKAAQVLRRQLDQEETDVPELERDEVFARPPRFKSLERAKRRRSPTP